MNGEKKPEWIICTDVGGFSFLHDIRRADSVDVPVFCVGLDKAKRFTSLGELMEVMAMIPAGFEAYEEDLLFIRWMESRGETPDNFS